MSINIDGYVLENAAKLLTKESDPIWIKLVRLAEARNIKVYLANKLTGIIRGLYFKNEQAAIIVIADTLKGEKRQFVMAHELGHVVLHTGCLDGLLYFNNKEYHKQVEREANAYAKRLLRFLKRRDYREQTY